MIQILLLHNLCIHSRHKEVRPTHWVPFPCAYCECTSYVRGVQRSLLLFLKLTRVLVQIPFLFEFKLNCCFLFFKKKEKNCLMTTWKLMETFFFFLFTYNKNKKNNNKGEAAQQILQQ
jgi:hypothetical protein